MTTVTITDSQIAFEGHAGNRDVCLSLSGVTQLLGALLSPQEQEKTKGLHRLMIAPTLSARNPKRMLFRKTWQLLKQYEEQYPDNVRLVDAR